MGPLKMAGRHTIAVLVAALAVAAGSLGLGTPARGLDMSNVGAPDATGFPAYYTDDSGASLTLCVDGSANCGGATTTDDGAGGPGVSVAPDGEGFYWSAETTLNSARGSLLIVMAHEAAWATATQRIVFDRLRVRGTLSQPGTYRLLTPYGTTRVVTDGAGVVNQTSDPLCAQVAGGACSPRFPNWLRASSAPAGYLGNAATPSSFTGGSVRNEFVLLAANGTVIGRQRRAIIMGKLAAGPAALMSADSVDFGNTANLARRSVTLKNQGSAPLALQGIGVLGARSVTVAPTGCAARASLAAGASCSINLVYRPARANVTSGTLVVDDNTLAGVHRLPVVARTTSEASAPARVRFGPRQVGTESGARRVVVTNSGVRPLRIKGLAIAGGDARSFERRTGTGPLCARGARLQPGRSCAAYVAFAPKSFGPKTSNLVLRTNAATSPDQVHLVGRGR